MGYSRSGYKSRNSYGKRSYTYKERVAYAKGKAAGRRTNRRSYGRY